MTVRTLLAHIQDRMQPGEQYFAVIVYSAEGTDPSIESKAKSPLQTGFDVVGPFDSNPGMLSFVGPLQHYGSPPFTIRILQGSAINAKVVVNPDLSSWELDLMERAEKWNKRH